MEINTKEFKRVVLVSVEGRIDSATAHELEQKLDQICNEGKTKIVVDLEKVSYISSAGLRVLVGMAKRLRKLRRGDVRLANLQPRLREVFDLAGLTPLFKVYDSTLDAVGSF